MGTFEDFIVKIKEAASFAGKKTGEAVEVSKLRISATETQNKIDREFTALGKKIYDAAKEQTDCTDFVREKSEVIDKLVEELAGLNKKISELRKEKVCPECGFANPENADYCQKCGAKL
jgi:ribosomal protein L40E